MERKRYDAHVHMFPERMLGVTDAVTGVKWGKFGEWIFDDGAFIVHRMPPYMEQSNFTAEALIATMDCYGIEKAAIMQSFMFRANQDIADAVKKYPDRLRGAMFIDPRDADVLEQIRHWHAEGLNIIKFEMKGFGHPKGYPDMKLDGDDVDRVLTEAEKLGLVFTIDTDEAGGSGYQVEALRRSAERHPNLKFVICHMFFAKLDYFSSEEKMNRWKQMRQLAELKNVWVDIAAMPDLFLAEGYPFPSALRLIEAFVQEFGEDKLLWGSDIPGTFNSATYREMINMFECDEALTETCKDKLFYLNAAQVYG